MVQQLEAETGRAPRQLAAGVAETDDTQGFVFKLERLAGEQPRRRPVGRLGIGLGLDQPLG